MTTKDEYLAALDRIKELYYDLDNSPSALRRFNEDTYLLNDLVNKHFESRQETNLDHYKDEILENCMWNLALVDGKPKRCNQIMCSECDFNKEIPRNCHKRTIEWLNQTYIKPKYKLTQFEYDLLQNYKGILRFKNMNTLNWMKEKGYFKGIDENETVGDILANCEVIDQCEKLD